MQAPRLSNLYYLLRSAKFSKITALRIVDALALMQIEGAAPDEVADALYQRENHRVREALAICRKRCEGVPFVPDHPEIYLPTIDESIREQSKEELLLFEFSDLKFPD